LVDFLMLWVSWPTSPTVKSVICLLGGVVKLGW